MFVTSDKKKKAGIHCCAYGCTSKPVARKGGLFHKHYRRKRNFVDPVYTRFENFKSNAVGRNIVFTITLQEFRDFCQRTGYIIKKGRRGRAYSVDRINNKFGYHIWNIQLLTMTQNIYKYHHEDKGVNEYAEIPF